MKGIYLFPNGSFSQNLIMFVVDTSFPAHTNQKKKLILGEGLTQGLHDITLTAQVEINFV